MQAVSRNKETNERIAVTYGDVESSVGLERWAVVVVGKS